ncbi:helix-turn-helix transcriptional regulator [Pseudonocardia alni]|uniref:helix-turn-helix domain-containing protein n=2 Tax=Pseudonocardia alni TaxID=33907 RepID=UPI0027A40E49|nr:helix-turn-helix transcriptional regulator [Pseudonocardia alni]
MSTAPDLRPDDAGPSFRHLVAAEVRAQMARERISNRKLAAKLGLKPAWVDRRLNGTTPMDTDDLELFAEALHVRLADLLANALQRVDGGRAGVASGSITARFVAASSSESDAPCPVIALPVRHPDVAPGYGSAGEPPAQGEAAVNRSVGGRVEHHVPAA